jgi:hypothetical protein
MGRRAGHSVAGLAFAMAALLLAPGVRAQQPRVEVTTPAPPPDGPPETPPVVTPVTPPAVMPVPPPAVTPEAPATVTPATPPATIPETPPSPIPPTPPPAIPPDAAPEIPEAVEEQLLALAPPPRPRLSLAVGMGATRDPTGFPDGGHFIPAFFGVGGFGDGLFGFDLGAFASSASGRFPTTDSPVDRLALDAFGVLRPAARVRPGDQRYRMRVLRTIGAELGLGFERDGQVAASGNRWVIHTGARIEFPLTSGQASELRLRLAVRRAFGLYTPELSTTSGSTGIVSVGDSTELYAALAVVF